jgi:serine/threonine-protein phosphatase 4 regulatory subunit 1
LEAIDGLIYVILIFLSQKIVRYLKNLVQLTFISKLRVRKTLSYSLHEVAQILGSQATEKSLLTVFDQFLKDVEEVSFHFLLLTYGKVKVGVVTHLADFLFVLSIDKRKAYLHLLMEIQADKHWRFRKLIAR